MSCDFIALANAGVQKLQPYQTGKPIEELQRELGISDIVKLASNENPLGPGKKAQAAAQQALAELHRYPDGAGFRLKAAIQKKFQFAPERITLGNGSNDLLELISLAYLLPGDEAIYAEHGFAVYPLATLARGATPVEVPAKNFGHDLPAMAAAVTEKTRVIFIANPNNPTGTWFGREAFEQFLKAVPQRVIVVLDEAYEEYVDEAAYPRGLDYVERFPNLVVTRTFSKIYGLASLRVGFAVSSAQVANILNRVRQPFNVNTPALAAAEAALFDDDYLNESRRINNAGLQQLTSGLEKLGLAVIPSVANFIAFDCSARFSEGGAQMYQLLLKEGVIVRPIGGYGLPNHLRVSVGLESENTRFLQALEKVLA